MEPWEEEAQRQWRVEREQAKLPRCQCCGEPIVSEQYLDLEPFGVDAYACESCVEDNLHSNGFGDDGGF